MTHGKDAVFLFDLESGKPERKVDLAGGDIRRLVADPARSRLVVGFESGAIGSVSLPDLTPGPRLEDAHDGKRRVPGPEPRRPPPGHAVPSIAWCCATRCRSSAADLPRVGRDAAGHDLRSNGRRLAVVGTDSDVDLWDLAALRDGLRPSAWPGTSPPPHRSCRPRRSNPEPPFRGHQSPRLVRGACADSGAKATQRSVEKL